MMKSLLNINMCIAIFVSAWLVGNILACSDKNKTDDCRVSCMICREKGTSTLICKPSTCSVNKGSYDSVKYCSKCTKKIPEPKSNKKDSTDNVYRRNKCIPSASCRRVEYQIQKKLKDEAGVSERLDETYEGNTIKRDDKSSIDNRGSSSTDGSSKDSIKSHKLPIKAEYLDSEDLRAKNVREEFTNTDSCTICAEQMLNTKISKEEFTDTADLMSKDVKVESTNTDTEDVLENIVKEESTDSDKSKYIVGKEEFTDTEDLVKTAVESTSTQKGTEGFESEINPIPESGSKDDSLMDLLGRISDGILSIGDIGKPYFNDAVVKESISDSMDCENCLNKEMTDENETTESQPSLVKSSLEKIYQLVRDTLSPSNSRTNEDKLDIDESSHTDTGMESSRRMSLRSNLGTESPDRQSTRSKSSLGVWTGSRTEESSQIDQSKASKNSPIDSETDSVVRSPSGMSQRSNFHPGSPIIGTGSPGETSGRSKGSLENIYDFVQNKLAGKSSQSVRTASDKSCCNIVTCGICETNTCSITGHNFCSWKKYVIHLVVAPYQELTSALKDIASGIRDGVYGESVNRCNLITCGCRETKTCPISRNQNHGFCVWKKCFIDSLKGTVAAIAGGIKGILVIKND